MGPADGYAGRDIFKVSSTGAYYVGPTCDPPGSRCRGPAMSLLLTAWADVDGSVSMLGVNLSHPNATREATAAGPGGEPGSRATAPAVIGSKYADGWWRLDGDCEDRGDHFVVGVVRAS